jgi:hypothetical protein
VIDQDLLSEVQYALMELPPTSDEADGGATWPSEVWRREDVLQAVTDAQATVLRTTKLLVTYVEQVVVPDARSVTLPADWLAHAHLAFRQQSLQIRGYLPPFDVFEADQAQDGWEETPGFPLGYLDGDTHTREIRLVPTPEALGILENTYVPQPDPVDGNGSDLLIPEIAISAVKYRTLQQLLSGPHRLQDPERAGYCDERAAVIEATVQMLLQGGA